MTTTETEAPANTNGKDKEDYTKYQTKEPTNLHRHYWDWIKNKTGIELDVTDEVAVKIVQIAVSAYQKYQASPENKQRRVDEADEREKAAAELKAKKAAEKQAKVEAAEKAKAAEATEAEAAGDGEGAKRQAPPKRGAASKTNKAAAGEAPF